MIVLCFSPKRSPGPSRPVALSDGRAAGAAVLGLNLRSTLEAIEPMAVKLEIPTALRQFAGKQASVEFNAATVGDALKQLTGTYGDLRKHLYTEDGRIRSFVNIYLNDEDIRYLQKENTPTKDGDTISIVPSIAGGAGETGEA